MTLLDVGCGWGSTMRRAVEKYDVNVIGLTLSKNQAGYRPEDCWTRDSPRTKEFADAAGRNSTSRSTGSCRSARSSTSATTVTTTSSRWPTTSLPDDGVMLLHTITGLTPAQMAERGMPLTFELARFIKFIVDEIFPGGRLPSIEMVEDLFAGRLQADSPPSHCSRITRGRWTAGRLRSRLKGRSHRDPVAGDVRPLHALPDRLREGIPGGLYRRQPIHPGEVVFTRIMNSDVVLTAVVKPGYCALATWVRLFPGQ